MDTITLDEGRSLRQIALASLGAIPIFESDGIDYYCHGERSLAEGCRAAGVEARGLLAKLSAAAGSSLAVPEPDWRQSSLVALLGHLEERHHRGQRTSVAAIYALYERAALDDPAEPSLAALGPILHALKDVTEAHHDVSTLLFADVLTLEAGSSLESAVLPRLASVVDKVAADHVRVQSLLGSAQHLAGAALTSARAAGRRADLLARLLACLVEWEREAHRHAHLENNVLVPWSADLDPTANRDVSPAASEPSSVVTW
jgi:iron-sulfur cluster repair protein YtfE (RIC family)